MLFLPPYWLSISCILANVAPAESIGMQNDGANVICIQLHEKLWPIQQTLEKHQMLQVDTGV